MSYSRFSIVHGAILGAITVVIIAIGTTHNVSAATPPKPTYTPLFTADFENSNVGDTIQEFAYPTTPAKTTYSNSIAGPFGGQRTVLQENTAGNKNFGGRILNTKLVKGQEIWVRWYEYFPAKFCFANGTNGDSNGGAGKMKWLRFQYPNNTTRVTFELDGTPSCTAPCTSCMTEMSVDSIIGEAMG